MRSDFDLQLALALLRWLRRRPAGLATRAGMGWLLEAWSGQQPFQATVLEAFESGDATWSAGDIHSVLAWAHRADSSSPAARQMRHYLDQPMLMLDEGSSELVLSQAMTEAFPGSAPKPRSRSLGRLAREWRVAVHDASFPEMSIFRAEPTHARSLETNELYVADFALDIDDEMALGLLGAERPAKVPAHTLISIWFGTDRAPADACRYGATFSGLRDLHDRVHYGVASVSVPDRHKEGEVERPSFWRLEFREDPEKHIVIRDVDVLDEATWVERAKQDSGQDEEGVLFVHGFNVSFDEALWRTAQIAYDLKLPGMPLCFSWASRGETLDYPSDELTATWSEAHLALFLRTVVGELGLTRLHVIAHSMGNRVLVEVLHQWQGQAGDTPISQVVLAAPDIDAGLLKQRAPMFAQFEQATLYASREDRPIKISRKYHDLPIAGDANPPLVLPQLATVDVSDVGAEIFGLGHSYFANAPKVFSDLFYIVRHRLKPKDRVSVKPVSTHGYYKLV